MILPTAILAKIRAAAPKEWLTFDDAVLPLDTLSEKEQDIARALHALLARPEMFCSDISVFENTILALCGRTNDVDLLSVCSPAEIVWGWQQVQAVTTLKTADLHVPVVAYIRACFSDAGVLVFPDSLAGIEPEEAKKIKAAVRQKINDNKFDLDSDDLVDVQAAKLAQVEQMAHLIAAQFASGR